MDTSLRGGQQTLSRTGILLGRESRGDGLLGNRAIMERSTELPRYRMCLGTCSSVMTDTAKNGDQTPTVDGRPNVSS